MKLFNSKYGIIVACDIDQLSDLENLIKATHDMDFIQGYKIGMDLVVPHGIFKVTGVIKKYTNLPIIYDHQKFGTDIPEICGGKVLEVLKNAGVNGVIAFPQSGIRTLEAIVIKCKELALTPIIGGEMTHVGYVVSEGGYIADYAPEKIYMDAARLGVEYFVIPGTKLDKMRIYCSKLKEVILEPKFLFPGIGRGQGGDIVAAFGAVHPYESYAIVGRGIYAEKNRKEAANILWDNVKRKISPKRY